MLGSFVLSSVCSLFEWISSVYFEMLCFCFLLIINKSSIGIRRNCTQILILVVLLFMQLAVVSAADID